MTTPAGLGYRRPLPASTVSGPGPDPIRLFGRTTRDWVVDVLFFLLAICFTVLSLVDSLEQHIAPVPLAVDLVLGGLSCLGVWLRRRWPVGLAVIVGLFSIYSMSASGVALIALFTVAVHRRFAVVGPIAAGYALVPFLTVLVRPDIPVAPWWQVVLGVVCVAAVLAWGMFVRARRQSLHERALRAESEQELLVARARQLERNRHVLDRGQGRNQVVGLEHEADRATAEARELGLAQARHLHAVHRDRARTRRVQASQQAEQR